MVSSPSVVTRALCGGMKQGERTLTVLVVSSSKIPSPNILESDPAFKTSVFHLLSVQL